MHRTVKQQLKHLTKREYKILRELTHGSKNLVNATIYIIRQHYFKTGKYLGYDDAYEIMKTKPEYAFLNSNMSQQIMKKVDLMYKSFFGLIRRRVAKEISCNVNEPHYLDKDGFYSLIIQSIPALTKNQFRIPYSNEFKKTHEYITIKLPKKVIGKNIKEIRIVPRCNARFFEVHYSYELEEVDVINDSNPNVLAIDTGLNNFATCVTSNGESFILDGRKIKSYNQWYNKYITYLEKIKGKQHIGRKYTKKQELVTRKRNNRIDDYINKCVKYIVDYCSRNNITYIVIGYDPDLQQKSNLGKKLNQTLTQIPFGQFRYKLAKKCQLLGIKFKDQEESYTSKASFFDNDDLPKYDKHNPKTYTFSGKRIKRGIYKTSFGKLVNADVNGALNILKKSKVVPDAIVSLYNRGDLNTPIRIRLHK